LAGFDLTSRQRWRSPTDAASAQFEASRRAADPVETELVRRAQQGDFDAFGELLGGHQASAQRMAMMLGLSPDDAADAVQEAFVRAFRAIHRFRLGKPFRPWLIAIVVNEVRSLHRSSGRRARLADRFAAGQVRQTDGPECDSLRREQGIELIDALQGLRDHDRLPIVYRYLLEFSEAETAAALGVPLGTAKSRVSRALDRLRKELGES
jgi:RNA polymerase sigma factor (sigma-70 family)